MEISNLADVTSSWPGFNDRSLRSAEEKKRPFTIQDDNENDETRVKIINSSAVIMKRQLEERPSCLVTTCARTHLHDRQRKHRAHK